MQKPRQAMENAMTAYLGLLGYKVRDAEKKIRAIREGTSEESKRIALVKNNVRESEL